MASTAAESDRVRRLSELRADRPVVLSLYLDLNTSEFATAPARKSAVRSLVDEAGKRIGAPEVSHEHSKMLRAALERAEEFLEGELPTEGAHAVAVFIAEPLGLFEAFALPHPSEPHRDRPHAARGAAGRPRPAAALVRGARQPGHRAGTARRPLGAGRGRGRQRGRPPQHDQGGWVPGATSAQSRRRWRSTCRRWLGSSRGSTTATRSTISPSAAPTSCSGTSAPSCAPRSQTAWPASSTWTSRPRPPATVLEAMQPLLEELQDGAEREALERLGAPLTAAGTNEVLAALNERRVEALLVDESRAQAGVVCPACGWVGPPSAKACPAGGGPTDEVEDLREPAVELTFQQDARVLPVRCRTDELREAGGIAAILRF